MHRTSTTAVVHAYGFVLARSAGLPGLPEKSLRISLAKRALADINDLVGAFQEIVGWQESLQDTVARQIDDLSLLRERLTDMLAEK